MSYGDNYAEVMLQIRRRARIMPLLMAVSMSAVACAIAACASIRFVARGVLPEIRINAVFFFVMVASAVASLMFFVSASALLRKVLRLVADVVAEKDALVDNALHDMKSAVTNISCNAQLVKSGDRDVPTGCDGIFASCERLVKILEDNIAITDNNMGLDERKLNPVDVKWLVSDIVAEFGYTADGKGVKLMCRVPEEELVVFADPSKLDALVGNLVENAVKYTPPGGSVVVSAEAFCEWIRLEVADTGIGMTGEVQERMYERFYRADMSTAEKGSGLGLAMVKSIVKFYGGRIDCKSAPGRGTTFTVELPLGKRRADRR